ncbi:DUF3846 domain-containing protein [Chakrabartyella piscis]|uniref:DUF3846 domain-containing protein n=1 Tax=Chakrabartyella piscis TaxID=2918914 RepID=UPI0029583427|nr:DUF3846 domain-containing protein [Chakrabartyella piscis]
MKEFDVTITETLKRTVTVYAETQHEAEEQAEFEWDKGIHVLDSGDFVGSNFQAVAEREKRIDALLVEPLKPPQHIQLSTELADLQKAVGGLIECINIFDDPVVIIANEEGKLNNLPLNRGIYDADNELHDIIAGTFLVVGEGDEDFESLTPELQDKYEKHFEKPEKFYSLAGSIIAQKIDIAKDKDIIKKPDMER